MVAKKQITPQQTQHSGIRIDETVPVDEIEKTFEIDKKEILFEGLMKERAERSRESK